MEMRSAVFVLAVAVMAAETPSPAATSGQPGRSTEQYPDWPNNRGPLCSGAAPDGGQELIEDLAQAKRVWQNDEAIPISYMRGVGQPYSKPEGGFCDPVVADGKVFVFWYQPSGPVSQNYLDGGKDQPAGRGGNVASFREKLGKDFMRVAGMIDADDIVLCLDAATGKTLWKKVLERKGINRNTLHGHAHGPQCMPAYADGKLYVLGAAGKVWRLDAARGEVEWESDIGPAAEAIARLKAEWKEKNNKPDMFGVEECPLLDSGLMVADGVVASSDWVAAGPRRSGWGMIGLDAATGKQLWRIPDCVARYATPLRWAHQGSEYFIGANWKHVVCIEPKTGKIVWEIKGDGKGFGSNKDGAGDEAVAGGGGTAAVNEDYLVIDRWNGDGRAGCMTRALGRTEATDWDKKDGITCYRLAADGAKKIWSLPVTLGALGDSSPVIYRDHAYITYNINGVTCVELATGKIKGQLKGTSLSYGGTAGGGRVFAANNMGIGQLRWFKADPGDFRALPASKKETIEMGPFLSSAYVAGRLYVRGPKYVSCWDLRKPEGTGR
jgi:outer membrane protein assembly factor BamB